MGVLCIFHQRSWRFPLCIPHHNLGRHIGTNRWHHFGSQAVSTPPWEGLVASQVGRQAGTHLPSLEGSNLVASQAGSQVGRQAVTQAGIQAVSHLPGDIASSQAGNTITPNNTPAREGPYLAGNNSPSTEAGSQAASQAGS